RESCNEPCWQGAGTTRTDRGSHECDPGQGGPPSGQELAFRRRIHDLPLGVLGNYGHRVGKSRPERRVWLTGLRILYLLLFRDVVGLPRRRTIFSLSKPGGRAV